VQALSHERADVRPDWILDPGVRTGSRPKRSHASVQLQRRAHGAQLVVFVRNRHAEQRHDLFTDRLVHEAAVPSHDLDGHVPDLRDEAMRIDRRHVFDERAVVRHDRHEAPLPVDAH